MVTVTKKGSKKSVGGGAKKGGAKKSSGGAKGGAKKGGAKKGGGKKGGAKTKGLIPPQVKKVAGAILSAAAAGAIKSAIEEAVPQVKKAAGVTESKKKR